MLRDSGEGGGGANRGITLTQLREFRKNEALTLDDLEAMSEEEAKQIYREKFWDHMGLDGINGRLSALIIFDQAVNRGRSGVKKLLKITITKTWKRNFDDNVTWEQLINAVNDVEDRRFFCRFLCDAQLTYADMAKNDPDKMRWLKGWLIRTHNLMMRYLI